MNWLDNLVNENTSFTERIEVDNLSVQRQACPYAIITYMDPRVNLQALGINPFTDKGETQSQVRIIRSLGAMADDRSLLTGIYLAGFKEIAIIMHTDCGCCLAWSKVDTLIENLQTSLPQHKVDLLETQIGKLNEANLRRWLKAFQDPWQAVIDEVQSIKTKSFLNDDLIVHGLVYCLETGNIDVVANGYKNGLSKRTC